MLSMLEMHKTPFSDGGYLLNVNVHWVDATYPADNLALRRYTTVQAAINAAVAGELVYVFPGTYTEQVVFKTGVNVQGQNTNTCIIQHPGVVGTVNDAPIVIRNLTFQAAGVSSIFEVNAAAPMALSVDIHDCRFQGAGSPNNVVNVVQNSLVYFFDCFFGQPTSSIPVFLTGNNAANFVGIINSVCNGLLSFNGGFTAAANLSGNGSLALNNAASATIERSHISTDTAGNTVELGTTGNVQLFDCTFDTLGLFAATDYRTLNVTAQPANCFISGCRHLYTVAAADYLVYSAAVSFMFNGTGNSYQVGMNGNCTNLATAIREVGSTGVEYNQIQDAIDAANSGDLVLVQPGTYTEQITVSSGVNMAGIDRASCIIQSAADPLSFAAGYTGSAIRDLTFHVTTLNNRIVDVNEGEPEFDNCDFTNGYIASDNKVAAINAEWLRCTIYWINITDTVAGFEGLFYWRDCTITSAVNIDSNFGQYYFYDSQLARTTVNADTNNSTIYFIRCDVNAFGGTICALSESNGGKFVLVRIINTDFSSFVGTLLNLDITQPLIDPVIADNNFQAAVVAASVDINVPAGRTITRCIFSNNSMSAGISGDGAFQFPDPVKRIGGTKDFFKTVDAALRSVAANDQVVLLNQDVTITSALTPPSFSIKIDGAHQFTLARSAGNPIMTLGANDDVSFTNIDLVGSLDVAGNAARLKVGAQTNLNGMIDVQSGNASTLIEVDQAEIMGDATDNYCIRINDADPTIEVKRSYLKANGANPAIYWDVATNNNLKLAWATVMHGNLGANNPFGRSGAQTPNFASHHSAYNLDPATGAIWTNLIVTEYDVFDVNADY